MKVQIKKIPDDELMVAIAPILGWRYGKWDL